MAASRRSKIDSTLLSKGEQLHELLVTRDLSALDALDDYVAEFDIWQSHWQERCKGTPKDKDLQAVGREVASQHAEVLRLAGELKDSIAVSLKSLKRRGKGLIAYADHLPKRISTMRTRKG